MRPIQSTQKTRPVVKDINSMNTSGIIWHLVKRHALFISITLNIVLVTFLVVVHLAMPFIAYVK
jgi:hypothetical protein